MKKLLPAFLVFLAFFLISPSSTQAQGCGGIMGSNVATNWYRENLEFIRNNAGCSGSIPIEVIITTAERDNPQLLLDLQNMLIEYNFIPTWRPWGNGMPQGEELQTWINAASVLTIGQFQLFNEPNNCYFGCFSGSSPNPTADAAAALAFLEASRRGEIAIPLTLMPLSPRTPDGGNFLSEQTYWTQFNNACGECVKDFNYIGLSIYPLTTPGTNPNENVNKFINDFNARVDFFASLGVNVATTGFLIAEAGLDPGSYGGNFEQRVRDTIAFAQALEARIISDPSLFINIDQITFFLMDENTGKQYLIYQQCDAAGNCQWVVEDFLAYNPNVPGVPGGPIFPINLTCTPSNPGDRTSRPVECDPCNLTGSFCPSCATSFTVHDEATFYWWDGEKCPSDKEEYWVYPEWEGKVTIDPTLTTIPFVGYKGEEDEQKYLADYFEGTNEYYQNYSKYWLDWIDHAGVLRKLTPMGYQNQLKEEMVERAVETKVNNIYEGGVHDYNLEYKGRLCWDLPFLADAFLAFVQRLGIGGPIEAIAGRAHYCLFEDNRLEGWGLDTLYGAIKSFNSSIEALNMSFLKIAVRRSTATDTTLTTLDNHFPPEPDEEDYVEKWNAWKESEWGKLWVVAPMFSREDTPGEIIPYLGWRPRDEPKYIPPTVEKVPHVARLYEATQEVQNMLVPSYDENLTFSQKKSEPIIASAKELAGENVLGEKTLLAQGPMVEIASINCTAVAWKVSCTIVVNATPKTGHVWVHANGAFLGINKTGYGLVYPYQTSVSPGTDSFTIHVNVVNHDVQPKPEANGYCTIQFDTNGNGGCTMGAPGEPGPGGCGLAGAMPVAVCDQPAITDPNDNDNLCCEKINIDLKAVDSFNITEWYKKCEANPNLPGCGSRSRDVSRQFGINLFHPYLTDIWNQTGKADTAGLFNIFRPAKVNGFQEIDAADEIQYYYKGSQELVEPATGKFYFNYLGGVQLSKEWVVNTLMPYIE